LLSSIFACRSAAVTAGNIPPRHKLDTVNPDPRTIRAVSSRPISATLCRQKAIEGMPCLTHPSIASFPDHWSAVIWFNANLEII
jgi:hypothetical protein